MFAILTEEKLNQKGLYYELKGEQYYPCLLPPGPDGEKEQLALIVQQIARAQGINE